MWTHLGIDVDLSGLTIADMRMAKAISLNYDGKPQVLEILARTLGNCRAIIIEIRSFSGETIKVTARAQVFCLDWHKEVELLERETYKTVVQKQVLESNAVAGFNEEFSVSTLTCIKHSLEDLQSSKTSLQAASLDPPRLESAFKISTPAEQEIFIFSPRLLDTILQCTTSLMNATELFNFGLELYEIRGWESLFAACPLSSDKEYEVVVQIDKACNGVALGNIHILKEEYLIGYISRVRAKRISLMPKAGIVRTHSVGWLDAKTQSAAIIAQSLRKNSR